MRQDDLVTLKGPGVTQPAGVEVDDVERVVFQRRPRVWGHRFVVAINLVEGRDKWIIRTELLFLLRLEVPTSKKYGGGSSGT